MSDKESKKKPASPGRFFGELFAGVLGSWLGGYPLWSYLEERASDRKVKGDASYSPTANSALILGAMVGNSIGVYLIGSTADTNGSYFATLLGTTLASIPLALGINEPYFPFYALTGGALLQSVGSSIGFNASCQNRTSAEAGTGLLNFRDGRASLSAPALSLQSNSRDGTTVIQYNICVIQIRGSFGRVAPAGRSD